jgi:hypothetical protein
MVRRAAALTVMSVALVGCDGSKSESARVRSVVQRYFAALESGNGSEVCSLLAPAAKQQMLRVMALIRLQTGQGGLDCPLYVKLIHTANHNQAKISAVSVTGDSATVGVSDAHVLPVEVLLAKTKAGWRISRLPVLRAPRKPIGG